MTREREVYLKALRSDDKNFGSESYGIELAKDGSAIGRAGVFFHVRLLSQEVAVANFGV